MSFWSEVQDLEAMWTWNFRFQMQHVKCVFWVRFYIRTPDHTFHIYTLHWLQILGLNPHIICTCMHLKFQVMHLKFHIMHLNFRLHIWKFRSCIWISGYASGISDHASELQVMHLNFKLCFWSFRSSIWKFRLCIWPLDYASEISDHTSEVQVMHLNFRLCIWNFRSCIQTSGCGSESSGYVFDLYIMHLKCHIVHLNGWKNYATKLKIYS